MYGKETNELRGGEMSLGLTEQSTCETPEGCPWDSPLKSCESGKFGLLRFADASEACYSGGQTEEEASE